MTKEIILTGIRANDEPTLGNYIGAMLPMAQLQKQYAGEYQINMFVPDLHSFTTPVDHAALQQNTMRNLKYFAAAGLDIENNETFIYRQSYIPAHSELTWILDCFTYVGEMSRMTQFKEKTQSFTEFMDVEEFNPVKEKDMFGLKKQNATVGLFNYPVLMAADILLYGAKWVPVGEDQTQHLEITRDIGMRMNEKFKNIFPDGVFSIPEEVKKQVEFAHHGNGVRIRSLTNPEKKMSKSIADPRGTILLSDDPKQAAKKVMGATTDSIGKINYDWDNQPGITNLLQLEALLTGKPQEEVNAQWSGKEKYGDLKKQVAATVEKHLQDFQVRFKGVDEKELTQKLEASEAAMAEVANETLLRAQRAVGLRPRP